MKICVDAGGTSIRFAYVDKSDNVICKYESGVNEFEGGKQGFNIALNQFLESTKDDPKVSGVPIDSIVVSAAGYVNNDQVKFTNTNWVISKELIASEFSKRLSDPEIFLLNDFEAIAYGLITIEEEDRVIIDDREGCGDTRIVCGPGTGLGLAGLKVIGDGKHDVVALPSEGGHQRFAVETETERKIAEANLEACTTYESILSGKGLQMLYDFFSHETHVPYADKYSPEKIITLANSGNVAGIRALEAFAYVLGGFCGNMVLSLGSTKGVYLWGGILKSFPIQLLEKNLVTRFKSRIKASSYPNVPIYLITNDTIALRGCSVYAIKCSERK